MGLAPIVEQTSQALDEDTIPDGDSSEPSAVASYDISEDEAAAWAAYGDEARNEEMSEEAMWAAYSSNEDEEEEDEYDEEADIEDSLGIGSW